MTELFDEMDIERAKELETLLSDKPYSFGEPYFNRKAWENGFSSEMKNKILSLAETELNNPEYEITEEIACLYKTIGDRKVSDRCHHGAIIRIGAFALAECIENRGRFIAPYEKAVTAYCNFNSWVLTAHDNNMENYYKKNITIDLHSSCSSFELSCADYILDDKVNPFIRNMIRENVNRRTFAPFLAILNGEKKASSWLNETTNNWNSVCLGAVLGAAFGLIKSKQTRSIFLTAWEKYIKNYRNGFTHDGYCSEGLGYWSYGFSHYIYAAELIRQATDGKLDYMNLQEIANDAVFPFKMHMGNGVYASIGDCAVGTVPQEYPVKYVKARYYGEDIGFNRDIERIYAVLTFAFDKFSHSEKLDFNLENPNTSYRSWFFDAGVLISRPAQNSSCKMAVCMKGGNNHEHHNHNDLGSFTVAINDVQLISDIGNECYCAKTFSKFRYDSSFFNSYGHSVPVVANKLQENNGNERIEEFLATTVDTQFCDTADRYKLDLSKAYDCEALKSLTREFCYDRSSLGSLCVTDEVLFDTKQNFETAILSYGECRVNDNNTVSIDFEGQSLLITIVCDKKIIISTKKLQGDIAYSENCYKGKIPTRIGIAVEQPYCSITLKCIINAVD